MATNPVVTIDSEHVMQMLQQARREVERGEAEVSVDLSSVRRLDASALDAFEELAGTAQEKSIKVSLRGVSVEIYKVLKLMNLTSRFGFG